MCWRFRVNSHRFSSAVVFSASLSLASEISFSLKENITKNVVNGCQKRTGVSFQVISSYFNRPSMKNTRVIFISKHRIFLKQSNQIPRQWRWSCANTCSVLSSSLSTCYDIDWDHQFVEYHLDLIMSMYMDFRICILYTDWIHCYESTCIVWHTRWTLNKRTIQYIVLNSCSRIFNQLLRCSSSRFRSCSSRCWCWRWCCRCNCSLYIALKFCCMSASIALTVCHYCYIVARK